MTGRKSEKYKQVRNIKKTTVGKKNRKSEEIREIETEIIIIRKNWVHEKTREKKGDKER